jgi:hypothetical protein
MPIVPDTKNWTWTAERPCPECGFDPADYPDAAIAPALAHIFATLRPEQWMRVGRRSDGARFSISTMGKYMTHDLVHHRWDVAG